jgi:hypothetical protein
MQTVIVPGAKKKCPEDDMRAAVGRILEKWQALYKPSMEYMASFIHLRTDS